MGFEIRSMLAAIAIAFGASPASAAMTEGQVEQLKSLVASGDVTTMVQFWNENLEYFTFDNPLEIALADFMAEIAATGRANDIPEKLAQTAGVAIASQPKADAGVVSQPMTRESVCRAALAHRDDLAHP